MLKLSLDQIGQTKAICQSLVDLGETDAWGHLVKTVETLIEAETPKDTQVNGADDALRVASRMCFVNGMRRVLQIPKAQRERLNSLQEQETKLRPKTQQ